MKDVITISLPSLIHRIGREEVKQAKVIALQYHCELKRVRRSRHWRLSGEAIKIQSFTLHLKTAPLQRERGGFRYLILKIETALLEHTDKLEPLEAKLARLINESPNITLSELIHITDCSLAEARTARFHADSW
ncbi:ribosome recycling factor family protein [Shewanella eurypsychrophilus]|uniref:Ribosome recycling factor family protein n=1 Tax=Shewanella eurypsychrophilus TaxID=2593656 RepID=A0ABX6VBT8_9GAMM|nr:MULTISPECIES: ribosome recycling factor family protein [Shewanella]QFU24159.1 ribosome recycling factor [Shewanella sp. YLB-09]QPG59366.1 ribosome recycling factor family protein [Shewanella eurypsychrophilus]